MDRADSNDGDVATGPPVSGQSLAGPQLAAVRLRRLGIPLLLIVLAFGFQGTRGIWEPDEGRLVAIALNMLESGDYLIPRLNEQDAHFAKPPLTYWMVAASIATFGRSEFAARVPDALAFVFTALLVWMLARTTGVASPLTAAMIWPTSLLPFLASSLVSLDMILTAFETLAVWGYLRWRCESAERGVWVMWLGFGLAFLTKGPPALLPLLSISAYELFIARDARFRGLLRPAPIAAFLVVACTWFAVVIAREGSLWHYFLVTETVDRMVTDIHGRNPGWAGLLSVYGPVIVLGMLPFSPVLAWCRVMRRSRYLATNRAAIPQPVKFLYLWMAMPLIVFAAAQSRLPLYLLPLTVPFALATAFHLERMRISPRVILNTAIVAATALLGFRLNTAYWRTDLDSRQLARSLESAVPLAAFDEVLFVDDSRAAYGLKFYTGKSIRAAYTIDAPRAGEHSHLFCDELKRTSTALLLVPAGQENRYRDIARSCNGTDLVSLGRAREFDLLANAPAPNSHVRAAWRRR